jgi:NADPH2:quinone reductase
MKAAVYYSTGTPDVFRYEDVPDPSVGEKDLLVRVEAVSIEGGDTLNRLRGEITRVPHIVGYQCGGTVLEVGAAAEGFEPGDRVVTVGLDGSHAELRSVQASFAWKLPEGLSTEAGACVPVAYGTADDCLFEFGRLTRGETALIHAGAGGVGIAAIQLAKRAGARVLATASSDEKLERLKALGLDEGIDYVNSDFVAEARRLTDGRGVDVIVDSVGARRFRGASTHSPTGVGALPSATPAGRSPRPSTSPPCARTTRRSPATSSVPSCSCRPVRTPWCRLSCNGWPAVISRW